MLVSEIEKMSVINLPSWGQNTGNYTPAAKWNLYSAEAWEYVIK